MVVQESKIIYTWRVDEKKRAQHKSLPFPTHELFWTDS